MSEERKFPTETIDLPSKGWFYEKDNPLSSGQVELKYMTAKEEDILTSANLIQKGVTIDRLLQALIVTEDVDFNSLLLGDKNGIMIAARVLAYGKDYPISVTCGKCRSRQTVEVDLTNLEEKEVEKPKKLNTNEFEFELPNTKKKLTFRLLTHGDERAIEKELSKLEDVGVITDDIDHSHSTRIKYSILAINGDESSGTIRNFVDNEFIARDSQTFRRYYNSLNPDVLLIHPFTCSNDECGAEGRVSVPIGPDFFWPEFGIQG